MRDTSIEIGGEQQDIESVRAVCRDQRWKQILPPLWISAFAYILEMAGNVGEWCEDIDDPSFYLHGPDRNPRSTVQPGDRPCVVRGGSWMFDARSLRTYARMSHPPTYRLAGVGFRYAK